MAKLTPAEINRRRLKIHTTNFDTKDCNIKELRQILRAGLALCERVELCGVPDVRAKELYITLNQNGSFSYDYRYKHGPVPLQDKYTQKTLDNFASKYRIKV